MSGAFLTSREIFENPIWQNIVEFRLFFLIYGKAIFSEEGYKQGNVFIGKGQWLRSYRNLQSDLEYIENRSIKKYSLSTIKRAVDNLIKDGRIKIEETELGTLFTVVNYDRYQGLDNYKKNIENAERTQSERRANGNETESERRQNNNKKEKKEKNDKKDKKKIIRDYTQNPKLITAINDFMEMRTKIKKPMTERALELLLNKLSAMADTEEEKIALLEQSITNSWLSIYPLKHDNSKGGQQNGSKRRIARTDTRDWEQLLGVK